MIKKDGNTYLTMDELNTYLEASIERRADVVTQRITSKKTATYA